MSKDPRFIDAANNDYRLHDSSSCKNGANDGYDMGAYLGVWKEPKPPSDTMELPERGAIAYPNPTKTGQVTFLYRLEASAEVTLRVYNIAKELVSIQTETKSSGNQRTVWFARDRAGRSLPPGFYVYQFTTRNSTADDVERWKRQKLMIIK